MYFPYLRGRLNELLAIRDLLKANKLSPHVLPVIEPIKLSATLVTTMDECIKQDHPLAIICNPAVGGFDVHDTTASKDIHRTNFLKMLTNKLIIKAYLLDKAAPTELPRLEEKYSISRSQWLLIANNHDSLQTYEKLFTAQSPKWILLPDSYRRHIRTKNKVLLEDHFTKKNRNSDYADDPDEFFSEDHRYYSSDGYVGFSDYSIIGSDFIEGGFAPYAVAIHLIYFKEDDSLRIHHFVSKSNEGIENPAGKYYEAVTDLANWVEENRLSEKSNSLALQAFLAQAKAETYPGLGSIKKLSLMHHLEIMGRYLEGCVK